MASTVSNPGSSTRPSNKDSSNRDIIGIAFPFRKEGGEFPKTARNIEAVRSDLLSLFETPIRSRIMRPNLGSNLVQLLFESTGPLLRARIDRSVRQTIANNEPRVSVLGVDIQEEKTLVKITIFYLVQGVTDSVSFEVDRDV